MITGTALGFSFEIHSPDAHVRTFLATALRYLDAGDSRAGAVRVRIEIRRRPDGEYEVRQHGSVIFVGAVTPALARVMNAINIGATRSAGVDPVLHCGVAAHHGRAVLLPGRPGAGKSTTLTALLTRGLAYITDEAAPIDVTGHIRPYPKPIVVGPGSWDAVSQARNARIDLTDDTMHAWWLDPGSLGGGVVREPTSVGAVVAPLYRHGSSLRVERLSRAEATTTMASNTFNLTEHGRSGIERIAQLTVDVPLLRITFGDVGEACEVILSELDR